MVELTDFQRGNRFLVAGAYPQAIEAFQRHEKCPAEAAQAYAAVGECCLRSNILTEPIPVVPGVELVSQGDRRSAEAWFRRALACDANNVRALWGLAELLPEKSSERLDLLERSVAVQPGILNLVALGDYCRTHLKDLQRAYALYCQAQQHAPRARTAYDRLKDICRRLGRGGEAKEWGQRWKETNERRRRVDGQG
jgi:tetratricopeptide (TPR) repeat protein